MGDPLSYPFYSENKNKVKAVTRIPLYEANRRNNTAVGH